jgi:Protein of unknown function (DUF1203)
MASVHFIALPTAVAHAYRNGGSDAYGRKPERHTSDGSGLPCRYCLAHIEGGEEYLILAHRPFSSIQPYAETGPIFLHARACSRYPETPEVPQAFLARERMMLRGYDAAERIVYGTGTIVPTDCIADTAAAILDDQAVAFVDLRSATNSCFQCRVKRKAG